MKASKDKKKSRSFRKTANNPILAQLLSKAEKKPRTLMLQEENFDTFQKFCRKNDLIVAHVIDELIADFLAKLSEKK